jgi:N-acetylmuramoyl-L-alanine amidase
MESLSFRPCNPSAQMAEPVNNRTRVVVSLAVLVTLLTGCRSRTVHRDARPANMMPVTALADCLGLEVDDGYNHGMLVLCGERGTVVFNPRFRGVFIDDRPCFLGHRVVIDNGRVSVPPGFVEECGRRLEPARPEPAEHGPTDPAPKPEYHVVIDPGHGGKDPGAIGANGNYEKTVNLVVSRLIAARLRRRGLRVTLTRDADVFVPLNRRAEIGNRLHADAFVSVHADAARSRSVRGFSLFICHTKPGYLDAQRAVKIAAECDLGRDACRHGLTASRSGSRRLASLIRSRMGRATDSPDRGTKLGALRVLERSLCPAVLVELGFMSNPAEERRLFTPSYQQTLAAAIGDGIVRFLDAR